MNDRRVITGTVLLAAFGLAIGCEDPGPSKTADLDATAAASMEMDWLEGETADGSWLVSWRPIGGPIPSLEPFSVEVRVVDPHGDPIPEGMTVLVDATMPHHGHGMNVEPRIDATGGGRFTAEGMLMHMPGRWEFTVDVLDEDSGRAEVERAQWTVTLDD